MGTAPREIQQMWLFSAAFVILQIHGMLNAQRFVGPGGSELELINQLEQLVDEEDLVSPIGAPPPVSNLQPASEHLTSKRMSRIPFYRFKSDGQLVPLNFRPFNGLNRAVKRAPFLSQRDTNCGVGFTSCY